MGRGVRFSTGLCSQPDASGRHGEDTLDRFLSQSHTRASYSDLLTPMLASWPPPPSTPQTGSMTTVCTAHRVLAVIYYWRDDEVAGMHLHANQRHSTNHVSNLLPDQRRTAVVANLSSSRWTNSRALSDTAQSTGQRALMHWAVPFWSEEHCQGRGQTGATKCHRTLPHGTAAGISRPG